MQKKRCFHSQNPPKFALMNILCFQLRKANILRAKDVASVVKEEYLRAQLEVEVDEDGARQQQERERGGVRRVGA